MSYLFTTYGLGILLTLDDQASRGIMGVGNSIEKLSMKAMSLTYMGRSLLNMGTSIAKPFVALGKELIRVNSDIETTRVTLTALYESRDLANNKIKEVMDYAKTSPFGFEDLKSAVVQFKTLGVEILGEGAFIETASGKTRQFIDIMGDLGAGLSGVARNGFRDVTYAIREFVTEGNMISFTRRLGVDLEQVIKKAGMSVGETIEERLENLANITEYLKFDGLMNDLFGTWSQTLSNMGDYWEIFLLGVGDSKLMRKLGGEDGGASLTVFDGFKHTLEQLNQMMQTFEFEGLGQAVGNALSAVIAPLDALGAKLVDVVHTIADVIIQHPKILEVIMVASAFASALFILAGAGLMAKGAMLMFGVGLGQIAGLVPGLLVLAGVGTVLSKVWQDCGDSISDGFARAKFIMSSSTEEMIGYYNSLKDAINRGDTSDQISARIALRIIEAKQLFKTFLELWNSDGLTVNNDTWEILTQMDLLGPTHNISGFIQYAKAFFKGFKDGLISVRDTVANVVENVLEHVEKLAESLFGAEVITDWSFGLSQFESLGHALSVMAAIGVPALLLLKTALSWIGGGSIIKGLDRMSGGFSAASGGISLLGGVVSKSIGSITGGLGKITDAMGDDLIRKDLFTKAVNEFSGVQGKIGGAFDEMTYAIKSGALYVKDGFTDFAGQLRGDISNIGLIFEKNKNLSKNAKETFNGIYPHEALNALTKTDSDFMMADVLYEQGKNLSQGFGQLGSTLVGGVGGLSKDVGKGILGFEKTLVSGFSKASMAVLTSPIFWILLAIAGIIVTVAAIMRANGDQIAYAFKPITDMLGEMGGLSGILDSFMGIITNFKDILVDAWNSEGMQTALDMLTSSIVDLIHNAAEMGATLFPMMMDLASAIIPLIAEAIGALMPLVPPIMMAIMDLISSLLPPLMSIIGSVIRIIQLLLPPIIKIAQLIIQVVLAILPPVISIIKVIIDVIMAIIAALMPIIELIAELIVTLVDFLLPIIQKQVDFFTSVLMPVITALVDIIGGFIVYFVDIVGGAISIIMEICSGLVEFIRTGFTEGWGKAWQGAVERFSGIFGKIKGIAVGIVNKVIDAINGAIRSMNNLKIPDWVPGLGGKGVNIPLIPKLAKGTHNWAGGLAVMNEVGGELVDLPKGARVYPHDESISKAFVDGMALAASNYGAIIGQSGDSIVNGIGIAASRISLPEPVSISDMVADGVSAAVNESISSYTDSMGMALATGINGIHPYYTTTVGSEFSEWMGAMLDTNESILEVMEASVTIFADNLPRGNTLSDISRAINDSAISRLVNESTRMNEALLGHSDVKNDIVGTNLVNSLVPLIDSYTPTDDRLGTPVSTVDNVPTSGISPTNQPLSTITPAQKAEWWPVQDDNESSTYVDNSDNSVTFEAGSIVIHIEKATDAEADRLAKLIMSKIEREQKRRNLATYRY